MSEIQKQNGEALIPKGAERNINDLKDGNLKNIGSNVSKNEELNEISTGENNIITAKIDLSAGNVKEDITEYSKKYLGKTLYGSYEDPSTKETKLSAKYFKESLNKSSNFNELLDYFKENNSKMSNKEKLYILSNIGTYQGNGYSYDVMNTKDFIDVSDEHLYDTMKRNILNGTYENKGGVCRHIHSFVSEVGEALGFKMGVLGIGDSQGGEPHAVSLGKDNDGNIFIIDYGTLYTGKNLSDLIDMYSSQSGVINMSNEITDAKGNTTRLFQSELGKKLYEYISTNNGNKTVNIKEDITDFKKGENIQINASINNKETNADILLKKSFLNKKLTSGVGVSYDKYENSYAEIENIGVYNKNSITLLDDKIGASVNVQGNIVKNKFSNTQKETELNGISIGFNGYGVKDIGENGKLTLSGEGNFGELKKDKDAINQYGNLSGKIEYDQKINDNLSANGFIGVNSDILAKNIRGGDGYKLFNDKIVGVGVQKQTQNYSLDAKASYTDGFGYDKVSGSIDLNTKKGVGVNFNMSEEIDKTGFVGNVTDGNIKISKTNKDGDFTIYGEAGKTFSQNKDETRAKLGVTYRK